MRTKSFIVLLLAAAFLAGCVVQSIQPLFTESEYVTDPGLIGTWVQKEDDGKEIGVWTFEADERRYKLAHTDEKGRKAVFHMAAGKIGTNTFFDFSLRDPLPGSELNDLAAVGLIAVHVFVKAVKTNDTLVLLAMDYEWLEKHLAENPKTIAHVIQDKRPILTGSTAELKAFVARHANDDKIFKNEIRLSPKKKAAAN